MHKVEIHRRLIEAVEGEGNSGRIVQVSAEVSLREVLFLRGWEGRRLWGRSRMNWVLIAEQPSVATFVAFQTGPDIKPEEAALRRERVESQGPRQ